jgi:hypothetical protein
LLHFKNSEGSRTPELVKILVFDPNSKTVTATFDITTEREVERATDLAGTGAAPDLTKIRATRWAALQPKLANEGFEIFPDYSPLPATGEGFDRRFSIPGQGISLSLHAVAVGEQGEERDDLVALVNHLPT